MATEILSNVPFVVTPEITFEYINQIICGDCEDILKQLPENCVDLIVTSPPYADQRKNTYGGISAENYVKWFLPKADQFFRILKPTGSFILNIKEQASLREREHTFMCLSLF